MGEDSRQAYEATRKANQPWRAWYKTQRWRNVRAAQLRAQPMCEMCKARGVDRAAVVCNHVKRHEGDYHAFWSGPFNSLCKACHNSDQQRIEGGGKARPMIGVDGWPVE